MTREKLVEMLDKSFYGCDCDDKECLESVSTGAMTDIKKALIEPAPDLAIFILGACFIDAMAGFRYGIVNTDKAESKNFKKFVLAYLPKQYHDNEGDTFYRRLRCDLAHNYISTKHEYAFLSDNSRESDHHKMLNGHLILHRRAFVKELQTAYKNLKKDILDESNDEVFDNAFKRYDKLGLMSF
jgi:hypothetical protein